MFCAGKGIGAGFRVFRVSDAFQCRAEGVGSAFSKLKKPWRAIFLTFVVWRN
jgi:hypothetical protein